MIRIRKPNGEAPPDFLEIAEKVREGKVLERVIEGCREKAGSALKEGVVPTENTSEEGEGIINKDTIIIIPSQLIQQYPFLLLGGGKNEVSISQILTLSLKNIEEVINKLGSEIQIKNGEKIQTINVNINIDFPKGEGKFRDFLLSSHKIVPKEFI